MRKIFDIIFLVVIVGVAFFYRSTIINVWTQSYQRYFPCRSPIAYSIGTFDSKFGISKSDFIKALNDAEQIWEKPIGKNLFNYSTNGNLKINLIYDTRQETTVKLQQMGMTVDNSKASYDQLKAKYNSLTASYNNQKAQLEAQISDYENKKAEYESKVSSVNRGKRITQQTIDQLNTERNALNQQIIIINQAQDDLNKMADEINSLVTALNQLATSLNINVAKFNTVGATLGGEFDEGLYKSDASGQEIDIYQFTDKTKLIRVLVHELGHALGLDHVDDPKAIMYRLNNGINEKTTNTDLVELKAKCGLK